MGPPSAKEDLELPRLLVDLRKHAGRTQRDLGRKVGVHEDTLARYERGVRRVPPDTLANLIVALKLDHDVADLLRAAWEYDEPYWSRRTRAATISAPATADFSTPTTPIVPTIISTPSEPVGSLSPKLPGAEELEAWITLTGDEPDADDSVRVRVAAGNLYLLALGKLDEQGLAHLLHCTVPVGWTVIPMLPVFTSMEHLMVAANLNPSWMELWAIEVEGTVLLSDLDLDEYLGINPWSGREFKLPADPYPLPGRAEELRHIFAEGDQKFALIRRKRRPLPVSGRAVRIGHCDVPG